MLVTTHTTHTMTTIAVTLRLADDVSDVARLRARHASTTSAGDDGPLPVIIITIDLVLGELALGCDMRRRVCVSTVYNKKLHTYMYI
jgi:hypothetical protein